MKLIDFLKADIERTSRRYAPEEAQQISLRDIRAWFLEGVITELEMHELLRLIRKEA